MRPDLPLRIGRTKVLQWVTFPELTLEQFESHYKTDNWFLERLEASAVVLVPYGPKGSLKKAKVVEAGDGKGFTAGELIWKANQIQNEVNPKSGNGIGIYRLGFEKGLPSYYIGDYLDQAGILKD